MLYSRIKLKNEYCWATPFNPAMQYMYRACDATEHDAVIDKGLLSDL